MKKLIIGLCTIFCTALICISIMQMKNITTQPISQPTEVAYIVKEYGGKLAVFSGSDTTPIAVYEVYIHLLPENDIELLRKGIVANDDYALLKTLENFGL